MINEPDQVFSNAIAVLVIFIFFFLVYAKLTKKTLKEAWNDLTSMINGGQNG